MARRQQTGADEIEVLRVLRAARDIHVILAAGQPRTVTWGIVPSVGPGHPGCNTPMRRLLTITAALEAGTGVALTIASPALVLILLGSLLDSPAGLVIGRVLGAALIALGVACWIARDDAHGRTTAGLVAAMLLYNIAVVGLLGYARIGLRLSGVGLWPAVILHAALAVWCVACLRIARQRGRGK